MGRVVAAGGAVGDEGASDGGTGRGGWVWVVMMSGLPGRLLVMCGGVSTVVVTPGPRTGQMTGVAGSWDVRSLPTGALRGIGRAQPRNGACRGIRGEEPLRSKRGCLRVVEPTKPGQLSRPCCGRVDARPISARLGRGVS